MSREPRIETDRFRLGVGTPPEHGFEVLVFIDDAEMTSAGAGMGMDPFEVFVPDNKLVATTEPHQVPIARCHCGVYGCGSTDVVIRREGDVVHWDWVYETPMARGITVPAQVYDAEVARLAEDHSWETPVIAASRRVLETADRAALARHGLTLDWVTQDPRDPHRLQASLGDEGVHYQVFVGVGWDAHSSAEAADALVTLLGEPPRTWTAQWHATSHGVEEPLPCAGPSWTRFRMPFE